MDKRIQLILQAKRSKDGVRNSHEKRVCIVSGGKHSVKVGGWRTGYIWVS